MTTVIANPTIVDALQTILEDPECDGITVVDLDHKLRGHDRQQGLADALAAARSGNPVIMVGWLPARDYAKQTAWHAAIAYGNVQFLRLPFDPMTLILAVRRARVNGYLMDALAVRLHEVGTVNAKIGVLKHNLPHAQRQGETALETWALEARNIFGDDMSIEELVMAVEDAKPETLPARMSSEWFPDLCIDAEGTLIVDGAINPTVRAAGEEAEGKGQPVTVWTGGNVAEVQAILYAAGITWKVTSKWLFRGVTVAAAMDDEPLDELRQKYGVKIERYEQVP